MYALKNRDLSIEECELDDIIIDVDGDDSLIGNQVFKLVNAIYQRNHNIGLTYFSLISRNS